jgi:hypothetical protein
MWGGVLRVVTPCILEVVTVVSEEHIYTMFYPEDGDDVMLRNDGNHLQDYTASQSREKVVCSVWT